MVVPENDLKWNVLRPTAGSFSFERADAVMQFAAQHGISVRGHTLVWHEALPAWFGSTVRADNAEQLLREHISTVVGRYAGRMHSWDVVNEAISMEDGRADGLRRTVWLEKMGPDYIEKAFRMAAAADPQAMLVYNENMLEYSWSGSKRTAVLALLRDLRSRGVPVHALGIQAHLNPNHTLDLPGLRTFLAEVAALGLKVIVTELDVTDSPFPADAAARDEAVASLYGQFMDAVLAGKATVAVVTWGLSDKYSWLQSNRPRDDGLPVRGLPFDQTLGRKSAYTSIAASLSRAPTR
jgi:endo-1,4-beta-xylanase